ncbi:MAG TPA: phage major capsid protein [Candidatus Saccharibacteria bacterium]|nr:phage major capsid protein [Candidatus Saccharibacteria bacterium]
MGNPLYTDALDLANHQGESWRKNIRGGVLAKLAPQDPQIKVGSTDHFTFTGTPKGELVGEGDDKSSNDGTPTKKTGKTYTVQVTYRFSNQVLWEDEDYQTGIVDGLVDNIAIALSRALDLIAIHGINPKTGTVSSQVSEYFTKVGNGVGRVTATNDPNADIEAQAEDLQEAGYVATGIAFDPVFAGKLARTRDENGVKLYPELGLGFNVENFQGLPAAASDTVSGRQELGAENARVQSLMGDFNAFQWGVARNVPLETIEYGDPDGNGDLKRTNEIAIRAEAVLGYVIFDDAAFSLIEKPAVS